MLKIVLVGLSQDGKSIWSGQNKTKEWKNKRRKKASCGPKL